MTETTLRIDGREIAARPGATILEAALAADIHIPHLCHHPDLKPVGVCRLCLVEVEGAGGHGWLAGPPRNRAWSSARTIQALTRRRITLELLVINHHGQCLSSAKNDHCQLQRVAAHVGVDQERMNRYRRPQPTGEIDDSNPFFTLDHDRCVLCGICVRTCDEIVGVGARTSLSAGRGRGSARSAASRSSSRVRIVRGVHGAVSRGGGCTQGIPAGHEMGDMPLGTQAKLLRTLQKPRQSAARRFRSTPRKVDARVIAATHPRSPPSRSPGNSSVKISSTGCPWWKFMSLRSRNGRKISGLLTDHFTEKFSRQFNKQIHGVTQRAQIILARHTLARKYPGAGKRASG